MAALRWTRVCGWTIAFATVVALAYGVPAWRQAHAAREHARIERARATGLEPIPCTMLPMANHRPPVDPRRFEIGVYPAFGDALALDLVGDRLTVVQITGAWDPGPRRPSREARRNTAVLPTDLAHALRAVLVDETTHARGKFPLPIDGVSWGFMAGGQCGYATSPDAHTRAAAFTDLVDALVAHARGETSGKSTREAALRKQLDALRLP